MSDTQPGFLAPYRVLDLTDHRGLLAGHMLAQLGAQVIQLEPPGGSTARRQPPFAPGWPEGEDSLFWAAYAAGKMSVVCDPAVELQLWETLLRSADFLIESASPAEGRPEWLAPERVAAINPAIVHVSITPFGLTGPKRAWHDSEITLWAAGGPLLLTRDLSGRPLRISVPQAYLHGAATAAGAALVAHAERVRSGFGQHVDLAVVQTLPQCTLGAILAEPIEHADFVPRPAPANSTRPPDLSGSGSLTRRSKWEVADGLAEMHLAMGPATGPSTNMLFAWMRAEGVLPDRFADWDWTVLHTRMRAGEITAKDLQEARDHVAAFLRPMRKAELMPAAIARGVRIAPIETIADLAASRQFAARGFLATVTGAGGDLRLPGAFASGTAGGFVAARPAPRLGDDRDAVCATWTGAAAARPRAGSTPRIPPFADLKVLDLAWVVAGPLIGRTLADFGATVIRVESANRVETARLMGPFPGGRHDVRQSALYETCNANKLGLSLDLSRTEARAVVRDLVGWADVLIESFTPGQMDRWQLGYTDLRAINPSLVMLSTSLTGQTGPFSRYSGYGNHGAAIAGFQNLVGPIEGSPVGPYGPYTDFVAPRFGLPALLAALDRRRRDGAGCWLDVSQTEAGVQFLAAQIADHSVTGRIATAAGNRDPAMAPHGVFPAAGDDEWVAIAVRSDEEWARLATLIGGEARDPFLSDLIGRRHKEDQLEALVAGWTSARTSQTIEESLQSIGIAGHRLVSVEHFPHDPQIVARAHLVRLPHPLSGETVIEAAPFRLSRTPARYDRAAPVYGRDNRHVLEEVLRYDQAAIAGLEACGALT